jgi:hypothetical protein
MRHMATLNNRTMFRFLIVISDFSFSLIFSPRPPEPVDRLAGASSPSSRTQRLLFAENHPIFAASPPNKSLSVRETSGAPPFGLPTVSEAFCIPIPSVPATKSDGFRAVATDINIKRQGMTKSFIISKKRNIGTCPIAYVFVCAKGMPA